MIDNFSSDISTSTIFCEFWLLDDCGRIEQKESIWICKKIKFNDEFKNAFGESIKWFACETGENFFIIFAGIGSF